MLYTVGAKLEDCKKGYGDYIKEMQSLKGFKLLNDMSLLKVTHDIFSGNFINLCYVVDIYENDLELAFLTNHQKRDEISLEILRLFHNYTASSFTLIRHSSNFKNKLDNENINAFYDKEVKRLNDIEVVTFMKDLRNYVQHRSFPITSQRFSVKMIEGTGRYEMEQKISLNLQELLTWDGWISKSKKYLKSLKDNIEIKPLCKEYYENIVKFNISFFDNVNKEYESDIKELKKFQEHLNELYPPPSRV
ncbi:hypothetical protein EQO05_00945 [Methanosarcina sp. MSH10X1]|uniref:hypothetical protein n=1 Tax=Methanosarcina sp. MSH10X1 TaxID=2507075 RepID=UPI000FFC2783|nr:hypothetical protein [Methanosarcina sp. MSH10X1]RXA21835.1 hypothetical protein EQO05_00945 [Methanosarcina sp. MSH10X1]